MSKKEKLVDRFCSLPKDFDWRELQQLLSYLGYEQHAGGKGVKFICITSGHVIALHPPHPGSIVKRVYLKNIRETLKEMKRL